MEFSCKRRLPPPADREPILTVVIDTEEEFDWSAPFDPQATSVTNIESQVLAQEVFDRYGVVPTYVIDYPVATSDQALAVLRPIADSGRCEIGAHLHPWVNPPLTGAVNSWHSFPGNLPEDLERQKLDALTRCIEQRFARRPTIYKAGRYGIGASTEKILHGLGFEFDVSVVPHTDFSPLGGPDFTDFPDQPFEMASGVVELPLSVNFVGRLAKLGAKLYPNISGAVGSKLHLPGLVSRMKLLERLRLSPEGHSLEDMIRQTRSAIAEGQRFFMLTYHSSSLLPGATSYIRTEADRRRFLESLDRYIAFFLSECGGCADAVSAVGRTLRDRRPHA
jgi:hypothetical protein